MKNKRVVIFELKDLLSSEKMEDQVYIDFALYLSRMKSSDSNRFIRKFERRASNPIIANQIGKIKKIVRNISTDRFKAFREILALYREYHAIEETPYGTKLADSILYKIGICCVSQFKEIDSDGEEVTETGRYWDSETILEIHSAIADMFASIDIERVDHNESMQLLFLQRITSMLKDYTNLDFQSVMRYYLEMLS